MVNQIFFNVNKDLPWALSAASKLAFSDWWKKGKIKNLEASLRPPAGKKSERM